MNPIIDAFASQSDCHLELRDLSMIEDWTHGRKLPELVNQFFAMISGGSFAVQPRSVFHFRQDPFKQSINEQFGETDLGRFLRYDLCFLFAEEEGEENAFGIDLNEDRFGEIFLYEGEGWRASTHCNYMCKDFAEFIEGFTYATDEPPLSQSTAHRVIRDLEPVIKDGDREEALIMSKIRPKTME